MNSEDIWDQFILSDSPTKEEIGLLQEHLHQFNLTRTDGEYDVPGIEINQIIKDDHGVVVGGVNASTVLRVMHLEVLWVADEYRKYGLARELVLGAERIGAANGCRSTQTMSFSFQAPGFYQKLGYQVLGIYTGYPFGISEYVLNKRLPTRENSGQRQEQIKFEGLPGNFTISDETTREEMKVLHQGLHSHVVENIDDKYKGLAIKLVIKDPSDKLIGGITGFTTINNLILESLWIEDGYRGKGLGKKLVKGAENIAITNGCTACQTMSLSFQSPGFFKKLGYEIFGVSDSYPEPIKESYFIKRFDR